MYLCPQSGVEDDAQEKGGVAKRSLQASDVLHLYIWDLRN